MINQCNFIGRLGSDPETRFTQNGTQVTTISLACSEKYKDKNGQYQEETEWVRIVAWNNLAEICGEYLKKGSLAFFSGKQKTRKWSDKNGVERYTTEIVAREMKMLDSQNQSSHSDSAQAERNLNSENTGADVPF